MPFVAGESLQNVMMSARLANTPSLAVASQRALFSIPDIVGSGPHANFDVSLDGKTLALVRRSPNRHIVVIQDLPALLRKLRGAGTASP